MTGRRPTQVRIASWPHWYAPNPYLELFYGALQPHGVVHIRHFDPETDPTVAVSSVDAFHLHWAYPYWRDGQPGPATQAVRVARLAHQLRALRRAGVPLLWTVHNLAHHEGDRLPDRLAYRLLHRMADLRIFHSRWARDEARSRYGETGGDMVVMPHGNYDGAFPDPAPGDVTRKALGVSSDARLLLCFGQLRRYKGFDVALEALRHLPRGRFHLVVAGRSVDGTGEALLRAAAHRRGVLVQPGDVEPQRLSDLLAAADVVLLPYRSVTGSGALLAALTFGCGVVASDLPYFREILDAHPGAGRLAPVEDPRALARAIDTFLARPAHERERAARQAAESYAWPRVVEPVARWITGNVRTIGSR